MAKKQDKDNKKGAGKSPLKGTNVVDLTSRIGKSTADIVAKAGVIIHYNPEFEDLELPDPQAGEVVVGLLEKDEVGLYVDYHNTFMDFDARIRELNSGVLTEAASHIRAGHDDLNALQRSVTDILDEEECEVLCRAKRRLDMLKGALFFSIAERLGNHKNVLGVRSHGRIVRSTVAGSTARS